MKTRTVEFFSEGVKLAGTVYLPDDYVEGTKLPCVIACSGFTGINAVYPALIARSLTQKGYCCLGFDYRGWAPSEGQVGVTTFESEYQDITAAYIFAQMQPEIEADNISFFGWGMSAPICIQIATDNPEIKAVAVGNGIYNGKRAVHSTLTPHEFLAREARAREDRIHRVLTGNPLEYVSCYHFNCSELVPMEQDYLTDTLTRLTPDIADIIKRDYGSAEAFPPDHSWAYWDSMMRLDADAYVAKLAPRGLFISHAVQDDGYGFYEAECLYQAAGEGAVLYKVEGRHNSWMFDDDPEYIKYADALAEFYDGYMK